MASAVVPQAVLADKVRKYEAFLNDHLKPDLKALQEARDRVYSEIADFEALKKSILVARELEEGQPLKAKVDLGCNFYAQARVDDPRRIFVEVGLGFFVELTLEEALKFADKRVKRLEETAEKLTDKACGVKASIKLTLEALRELQGVSTEDLLQKRDRRRDLGLQ